MNRHIFLAEEDSPWNYPVVSRNNADKNENENKTKTKMKTNTKTTSKVAPTPATKTPKKKPLTSDELIAARDRLHELNQEMEERREEQLAIRNYLADRLHDGEEGSKTFTVDSIKLTVTRNLRRTITREEADRLRQEHADIYALALRFTPEVRVGEYKKNAEIMDSYIVTKESPPEVKFA